jgi:phenylacetate-CoA ligase
MIERLYSAVVATLDWLLWHLDFGPAIHRWYLAPQLGNFRVALGRIRAVRVYRFAARRVPAYADYLKHHPHRGPRIGWRTVSLRDIPEIDKNSYVKQYTLLEKLTDGRLPDRGVMFDESSGSSGKPTSWVRGAKERRLTRRIMQVAFHELIEDKKPIILNTFAMGAWATGFNTSLCLLDIGRIKSIGPDRTKVIDTLQELGPDFEYVILGYPPFLRLLTESKEIDWQKYHITALYGGEGLSEQMRAYLQQYYRKVLGSYGASDLEINIAHESDFTIALRQALVHDTKLQELLLKANRGIIPMVFQYNPYDYLFETNDKGELLVTICRTENLSPRIRYNIHDLGHTMDFYELKKLLKAHGYGSLLKYAKLDFGMLFHYGRSDLSVDYNGAVVGPEEIKQIIAAAPKFNDKVSTFRLISYEDEEARKHLMIAVEAAEGKTLGKTEEQALLATIIEQLQIMNLDFKSAYSTAQLKPELKLYKYGEGIFDASHTKLKNDYIWSIDYARALKEGIAA